MRVNYSPGSVPIVVPEGELQSKSSRYYFTDSIKLNATEVFVSPFDLNVENGTVEIPYKPMIRFATPIFDRNNTKQGIIVFNYLGAHLMEHLKEIVSGEMADYMLLNLNGYWLHGRTQDEEWGFMFEGGENNRMGEVYPEAWEIISSGNKGSFLNDDGFFSFLTTTPVDNANGERLTWKIVSHIPTATLSDIKKNIISDYLSIVLLISLVLAFVSWKLAGQRRLAILLAEKNLLITEIHHRVKNNMAIMLSLLDLQCEYNQGAEVRECLGDTRSRLRAMALVHEHLYKNKNLSDIKVSEYLKSMLRSIVSTFKIDPAHIAFEVEAEDITLPMDLLIPCGLMINELVTNSIKHAFIDTEKGKVLVSVKSAGCRGYTLVVQDNGNGLPNDIDMTATLGLQLVNSLLSQLDGSLEINRDDGTQFIIKFSETRKY
jgi:two-component sensor histidine kinase